MGGRLHVVDSKSSLEVQLAPNLANDYYLKLHTARSNTIWQESETLITRLIRNTLGTGAAIAACGLLTLILFVTSPETSLQYLSACVSFLPLAHVLY